MLPLLKEKGISPVMVCDNDSRLWGGTLRADGIELPIESYETMRERYSDYVIVITTMISAARQIAQQLREKGETNPIFHMSNPFKVEERFLPYEEKYEQYADWFADGKSRELYADFLKYKMTGNAFAIADALSGNTFFDSELLMRDENEVYVDVGAFTGDTICKFLQFSGGQYARIVGIEADTGNAAAAGLFLKYGCVENAEIINKGCWSERTTLKFHTITNNADLNYNSPNFYRGVRADIDRKNDTYSSQKGLTAVDVEMEVDTLDHMVGALHPTLMKINALAADYPILLGAEGILSSDKPALMMEYGTRPGYIADTLEYLKHTVPEYRFYLRVKRISLGEQGADLKVVLYVLPPRG